MVLKLGSRLQYSQLPLDKEQPIILPKCTHFTRLAVEDAHYYTLLGSPQQMQSYLNRSV